MLKHVCAIAETAAGIALLLSGATAGAQALSFEQIAAQALATHPAIQSRFSSSAAAKAELDGAAWQRYPTPSVEVDSDNHGATTTLLRLQQPIWSGGRIEAGIDAANSRHHAAETAIGETKQEIVSRVISAYVEALRQQARKETLAKSVQQHEQLLGLISRRVEHDASPRVDQELAQSRLYQTVNDLSATEQALANALTQLSQLCGAPVHQVDAQSANKVLDQPGKESLLDQAMAWSPTLRRLSYESDAAQAEIEAKRAAYKPQISVRLENARTSAAVNGIPAYSANRVLLVFEAQTGAGLSAASGVQAAIARRDAALQQREAAVRDLRERIAVDWDELQAARLRLDTATLASRGAQEVYESYTRQFTAGRKTWLDVLNAVRESTLSATAATDAGAQVAGAALRLRLATGNLQGLTE